MTPRTQHSLPGVPSSPLVPSFELGQGTFVTATHDTAHALFAPLHYEPNYAYPLLVWLHGQGDDERQLTRVMPLVSMRNYVAVAPRGTLVGVPGGRSGEGYGWQQSEEHIRQAGQRIFDCLEIASTKFHVAPWRVFLAGFDAGGTMAFRIALEHPGRFAGVLSLGGAFPTGRTPLGRLTESRRVPVFLAVGRHSQPYPSADVCNDLRLLHAAGMSLTLRQYPCGHELSPQMLADVDRWIIDQINPVKAAPAESDPEWSREAE